MSSEIVKRKTTQIHHHHISLECVSASQAILGQVPRYMWQVMSKKTDSDRLQRVLHEIARENRYRTLAQ